MISTINTQNRSANYHFDGRNVAALFPQEQIFDFPLSPSPVIQNTQQDDVQVLLNMHQQLSKETLFKRYQSSRTPRRSEIEQICRLNGDNSRLGKGRSFVIVLPGEERQIVGIGFYVINGNAPITAGIAILVADAYQGQGLGRKMMNHMVDSALVQGVRFFEADMLTSNRCMCHLLMSSGKLVENHISYGSVEMRVQIADVQLFA